MAIKYPSMDCVTNIDKLEFLYQVQGALRLEHNEEGRKRRHGELSEKGWLSYKEGIFKPKSKQILADTAQIREKLGYSSLDNERAVDKSMKEKGRFQMSTRYEIDLTMVMTG